MSAVENMLSQQQFDALFGAAISSLETWQLHDALRLMEEAVAVRMDSVCHCRRTEKRNRRRNRDVPRRRERRLKNALERVAVKADRVWGTYQEYLDSPEWKALRKRIFVRDKSKCLACGNRADEVHHRAYDRDTMAGRRLHMLVSLCRECHEHIHFTADGEKLTGEIVDIRLSERRIQEFGEHDSVIVNGVVQWHQVIENNVHSARQKRVLEELLAPYRKGDT